MKKETFAAYANLCALKKREAHDAMARVEQEVDEAERAIDENKAKMASHDRAATQRLLGGVDARFLDLLERERAQLEREILASRAALGRKQAKRARAVLLGHHPPDRPKPDRQGRPGAFEDRACYDGNMLPTRRTHEQAALCGPARSFPATMTSESIRPAQLEKICPARLLRRKAGFEFCHRSRVVFQGRKMLYLGGT